MPELLDTSVLIDLDEPSVFQHLEGESAICAISLAELAMGVHLARDPVSRARRLFRLQQLESEFRPIPFDEGCALAFGEVVAQAMAAGRTHRSRMADFQIAATALHHRITLVTRNGSDFEHLSPLITVKVI